MRRSESTTLILSEECGGGRISVDMEAFFEFNFQLTEDLEILVDDWRHTASEWDGGRAFWFPGDAPRRWD
tara:strand:+ start:134 stop:343 length:210 start_codon:yes stop_codon:yes gene_type:complete